MLVIYINANTHTMDEKNSIANSFVVRDNKFVFVGTEEDARSFAKNEEYKEVDLKNKLVLPGFIDSHMHFLHFAKSQKCVNLVGVKSIKEIREKIKERMATRKDDDKSWIEGEGWNHDYFTDEKRFPNKFDLDDITKDVPTLVMRTCFHIGALNTAAMNLIGLNRETAHMYGDFVEVLENGEPNGVIKENMLEKVKSYVSNVTVEDIKNLVEEAQSKVLSQGITSMHSDDVGYTSNNNYKDLFQAFKELEDENKLNVRLGEQCLLKSLEKIKNFFEDGYTINYGTDKFKINCIKILGDGSLGARTAVLRGYYADDKTSEGILIHEENNLNEMVEICHKNNFPVAIHAIGDKTIELAINAIEKAKELYPNNYIRHGIVHCQITDDNLLKRIRALDILALIQPIFIDYDMNIVYDRVGKELAETSYAWKTMIDYGIHTSFGTDCPVEKFDTMPNIYTAVTRKNINTNGKEKKIFIPNEKLSMDEAIKAYTLEGAYASGEEKKKGSIEAGKLADFIVLDKDLFNLDNEEEILDTCVLETYVDGKLVYKR